jgi:SpoVK/Ycf46/Vps4 family AAA+-type ATPase
MTFPQEFARRIKPRYSLSGLTVSPDALGRLQSVVDGTGASATATALFLSGSRVATALAAEAVAYEMGRDLVRIDLAAVVSKYIGETEKNLDRLVSAVDPRTSILFFDEADALFGKRSEVKDAHDRYANQEAAYLLQRLESFGGVAIFSTSSPVLRVPCKQECHVIDLTLRSK